MQSYLEELTRNPSIRRHQLCLDSIGLRLRGGEGSLGGAQDDLQMTALTGRLRVAVHRRVPLTKITTGVVSIIGVERVIRGSYRCR